MPRFAMRRPALWLFIIMTAVLVVVFNIQQSGTGLVAELPSVPAAGEASYPIKKIVRYSFSVTNTTDKPLHEAKFVTFSPVPLTPTQRIGEIEANQPYRAIDDKLGNRRLEFVIALLPPFASKDIVITAEVFLAEKPNESPLSNDNRNRYLSDEIYVDLDSPYVKKISEKFQAIEEKPEQIYRWSAENIKDIGYVAEDRGAEYALKYLKGDCTEYMYSFVSLTRYQKIPSRSVAGFLVDDSEQLLRPGNYHNWAEYYDGRRWILVDPQRRQFNNGYTNYIAFREISDQEDAPLSSAERFLAFDPGLLIRMN